MNSPTQEHEKTRFHTLMATLLTLDAAIQWVAIEEAGREPYWVWRDTISGELRAGSTTEAAVLVDPLILMLAEWRLDPERPYDADQLLFVVLNYVDLVHIVIPLGKYAHISVATLPGADPRRVGMKLIGLLRQPAPVPVDIDAHCPAGPCFASKGVGQGTRDEQDPDGDLKWAGDRSEAPHYGGSKTHPQGFGVRGVKAGYRPAGGMM